MKTYIWLACVVCFLAGCAKTPETVHSVGVKIDYKLDGSNETFLVHISGAVRNENTGDAFINATGSVGVKDPDIDKVLISIPFKFDVILPMASGILDIQKEISSKEASFLLDFLKIDRQSLVARGTSEGQFLSEEQVVLEDFEFQKKDIVKLLKEKL